MHDKTQRRRVVAIGRSPHGSAGVDRPRVGGRGEPDDQQMQHHQVLEVEQLPPRRAVSREDERGQSEDRAGDAEPCADGEPDAGDDRDDDQAVTSRRRSVRRATPGRRHRRSRRHVRSRSWSSTGTRRTRYDNARHPERDAKRRQALGRCGRGEDGRPLIAAPSCMWRGRCVRAGSAPPRPGRPRRGAPSPPRPLRSTDRRPGRRSPRTVPGHGRRGSPSEVHRRRSADRCSHRSRRGSDAARFPGR